MINFSKPIKKHKLSKGKENSEEFYYHYVVSYNFNGKNTYCHTYGSSTSTLALSQMTANNGLLAKYSNNLIRGGGFI